MIVILKCDQCERDAPRSDRAFFGDRYAPGWLDLGQLGARSRLFCCWACLAEWSAERAREEAA